MEFITQSFHHLGFDVLCPNLYPVDKRFSYDQEQEAYDYFINNIGFSNAAHIIQVLIKENKENYQQVFLTGFSIGATVAWLCSDKVPVDGIVCFYGSRIRDYIQIVPRCPALLLFPSEEKSFDIQALLKKLNRKEKVYIQLFDANHGFANPYSSEFCKKSFDESFRLISSMLLKSGS